MTEAAAFAEHARRFCAFVENASRLALRERVMTARVLVLELYRAALELPSGEPGDSGSQPQRPADWPGFDRFEYYFETLDLFDVEGGVGAGLLSDDLLDIYFDVRRGLDLFPSASAVWEWRFSFEAHWGRHAVGALRALHHACREV